MADNIPLAAYPQVQRAAPGQMLDLNAGSAPWRALDSVGGAIQQAAGVLANYGIQRQRLADDAELSRQRMANKETWATIQARIEENPDAHEEWTIFAEEAWSERKDSLKLDDKKLSAEARQRILQDFEFSMQEGMVQVATQQRRRGIQADNAALEVEAIELARNGDRDGAVAVIGQMNLNPEQKVNKIRQVIEAGAFDEAVIMLDAMESVGEKEDFLAALQEKEGDAYKQFDGLSYAGRKRLEATTISRIRQQKFKQTRDAQQFIMNAQKGSLTVEDVNHAVATGVIPDDAAPSITAIIANEGNYERDFDEDYEDIVNKLGKTSWDMTSTGKQFSDAHWSDIFATISKAKLSKTSKQELTLKALDLKANDLSDGEEEGTGWFFDRTISEPEKVLRENLIDHYRGLVPVLREDIIFKMLETHQKVVREYFDNDKTDKTPGGIEAFMNSLLVPYRQEAARESIEDMWTE